MALKIKVKFDELNLIMIDLEINSMILQQKKPLFKNFFIKIKIL